MFTSPNESCKKSPEVFQIPHEVANISLDEALKPHEDKDATMMLDDFDEVYNQIVQAKWKLKEAEVRKLGSALYPFISHNTNFEISKIKKLSKIAELTQSINKLIIEKEAHASKQFDFFVEDPKYKLEQLRYDKEIQLLEYDIREHHLKMREDGTFLGALTALTTLHSNISSVLEKINKK